MRLADILKPDCQAFIREIVRIAYDSFTEAEKGKTES
jgi:hypothetical protein